MNDDRIDKEEILKRINERKWYHSFEVLPGIITPGKVSVNSERILDSCNVPKTLKGLTALDIGTWDGPYAFELEKRGAKVTALDIQDPECTGFNIAKELRQSKVQYVQASVYDLSKVLTEKYDIICFFGVFYHLKSPIFAFEQISSVLAENGMLLLEGECLLNYAEDLSGKVCHKIRLFEVLGETITGGGWRKLPKLVDYILQYYRKLFPEKPHRLTMDISNSNIPITLCYPGSYKGAHNWFVPNLACIKSWLIASGLELTWYKFTCNKFPGQRVRGIAKKAKNGDIVLEHRLADGKTRFW